MITIVDAHDGDDIDGNSPPDCTEDNADDEAEDEKADDDEKSNVWRRHLPLFALLFLRRILGWRARRGLIMIIMIVALGKHLSLQPTQFVFSGIKYVCAK